MVLPFRNKTKEKQKLVNVQEVYSIWDYGRTKYSTLESHNIYLNFAHDTEFKAILAKRITDTRKEINHIEELLKQYKITAPKPFRKDIRTAINTEVLTDKYIASNLLFTQQELIEMTLRAFRSSVTNDNIRRFFMDYTFNEIKWLDRFIKYFKVKG